MSTSTRRTTEISPMSLGGLRDENRRVLRPLAPTSINKTIDVLGSYLSVAVNHGKATNERRPRPTPAPENAVGQIMAPLFGTRAGEHQGRDKRMAVGVAPLRRGVFQALAPETGARTRQGRNAKPSR